MASDLTTRLGGARSSLAFKAPCRVATTANIALTGTQTIDGVAVVAEDRVLVKDQTDASENGIYICKATGWQRARDFDGTDDVVKGTRVYVHSGSVGSGSYVVTTADEIEIGTSDIAFAVTITESDVSAFARTLFDDASAAAARATLGAVEDVTTTRGDLIRRGASAVERVGIGTSGYAWLSDGTDPAWTGFEPAGSGAVTRTWRSKLRDRVCVVDYGAVGDGDIANAAVNAAALTAALATGKSVEIPWTSSGYHFGTNNAIAVSHGQRILGEGHVKLKSTVTGSNCFLRLVGFDDQSGIENVAFDMTGAGASSTAIRFGTNSATPVYRVRLKGLRFANCVEAIGDESHATNYIVDVDLDDIFCWLTLGTQIRSRRSRGFINWRNVKIYNNENPVRVVTWDSIIVDDFIGIDFDTVSVTGPTQNASLVYQSAVWAMRIGSATEQSETVYLRNMLVDNTTSNGMLIENCVNIEGDTLQAFQNLGNQIYLKDCAQFSLTKPKGYGAIGITNAAAAASGITLEDCNNGTIVAPETEVNTGQGLVLVDTTDVNVIAPRSENNTLYGLAESGTANRNTFLVPSLTSNGSGPYTLAGANSRILLSEEIVERTLAQTLTNKTMTAQKIADGGFIADANGNEQVKFATTASAINEVTLTNAAIGNNPSLAATGGDTNIGFSLAGKGTGGVILGGTGTNDSAAAGKVGEYIESVIASGSAVGLTSTTPANMTSISLTAGDWDVDCVFQFTGAAATTVTYLIGSISTTSATLDSTAGRRSSLQENAVTAFNNIDGAIITISIPALRFSLSGTTTLYAVAQALFGTSTCSVFGILRARRVR